MNHQILTHDKNMPIRRVGYVHDTTQYGGVEVFLLLLIKHLSPTRYTPVILVPDFDDPWRSSPPRFIQQAKDLGLPLIRLPKRPTTPGLGLLRQIQETARVFKENELDVIHIHTCRPLGAQVSTISAWLSNVPALVRTEHGPPLGVTPMTWLKVKPLDWVTDYILTVSDATLEDQVALVRRKRNKLYRSYGGIEVEKYVPEHNTRQAKIQLGLDPNLPVVGSIGRLMPEKGHTYLIKAASRVIQEYGAVNFLLVGEGYLEQKLKQEVAELGLTPYVHITGYVQNIDLYRRAIDIGVMPSVFEGLGLALLELMASGIPTITSAVPCFREVIESDKSGLIAPLEEENSLADHILRLLNDPEMASRMGNAARERIRSQFSVERLANDMMDLYDRVIDSKSQNLSANTKEQTGLMNYS
jgi:glycosyltransferase involved in cell wall biosynthesis